MAPKKITKTIDRPSLIIAIISISIIVIAVVLGVVASLVLEDPASQITLICLICFVLFFGLVMFVVLEVRRRRALRENKNMRSVTANVMTASLYSTNQNNGVSGISANNPILAQNSNNGYNAVSVRNGSWNFSPDYDEETLSS